jgi:hypothetical protein
VNTRFAIIGDVMDMHAGTHPPIDITGAMEAYFGLVEIGREFAVQGLMLDGLSRTDAEREWGRLQRDQFARREDPPFSARFPEAGIWA